MASPRDSGAAQLPPAASSPPPLHAMDADEEDDNVKQLKECATLYLSLQECLAETNRNWKSCQSSEAIASDPWWRNNPRRPSPPPAVDPLSSLRSSAAAAPGATARDRTPTPRTRPAASQPPAISAGSASGS
ncbi:uncharacterized protein LOC104000621 isoform X2 [Musa acuminata AAA Group]|uniref:uncharacterized protein LOC104000621 isoform X2 n=1 Tax=Musa acuminata AAA Group TaxID=214697 RepID=UPI0031D9D3B2